MEQALTAKWKAIADEGPNPAQAVAEALSAVNALAEMGLWPGPRDAANAAAVNEVRKRWALFPKDISPAPRRWAERWYDIMGRGAGTTRCDLRAFAVKLQMA